MIRNKLSRKGSKKVQALDESLDDFEPVPLKRSQRISKSQPVVKKSPASQNVLPPTKDVTSDSASSDVEQQKPAAATRECPFCQKDFPKSVSEAKRNAHLKVCGIHKGFKPEDLVKVRRLEEKQAAEWADLGLPKPANKSTTTGGSTNITSRKKTSTKAEDYGGKKLV